MNAKQRMTWFKQNFGAKIAAATAGGPLTVDLITAIAHQETGYLWPASLRHHDGDVNEVLHDCVGDTLNYPQRNASAFPRNKADLLSKSFGEDMFDVAREALQRIGRVVPAYRKVYENDPDKFCHGFGILQYDIQHALTDPDFFLEQQWADFDLCLERCIAELEFGLRKRGYEDATHLSDFELATVAIVYNTGGYKSSRGMRQGHKSGNKYYGEWIKEYIAIAKTIDVDLEYYENDDSDGSTDSTSEKYIVTARSGLNLRGGPGTDYSINDTIAAWTEVNVLALMGPREDWALVDLQGDGDRDGFMYAKFLARMSNNIADSDAIEDMLRMELISAEEHPIFWDNYGTNEYPD